MAMHIKYQNRRNIGAEKANYAIFAIYRENKKLGKCS
jgi:hypothetical protein